METKVVTGKEMVVGKIGKVEIGETNKLGIFLPLIVYNQKKQLLLKEIEPGKCSQVTRLKGPTRC